MRGIMFVMKKYLGIFVGFLSVLAPVMVAHAYVNRESAALRVMNKAAGKVYSVVAPVGQTVQFEKLGITVRSCMQSDPFDAENFFAFVEISKTDEGKIFSNWMNANEPGDNPVQNADYDVWLAKCE